MPNSKYELRSEQAEEMINKMPHFIVLWGNMFILAGLILGVFLLSRIELNQYSIVQAVVRGIDKQTRGKSSFELGIQLYKDPVAPKRQVLSLQFTRQGGEAEILRGKVTCIKKIDSFDYVLKVQPLDTSSASNLAELPDSGQICTAKLIAGKSDILSTIGHQLNNMLGHH